MTGTDLFLLMVLGLTWMFTIWVQWFSYREGHDHGYGEGYDDCQDEGFHGDPPGTRDKRNNPHREARP